MVQHQPITDTISSIEAVEALLPPVPNPIGSYVPCIQVGTLVLTSGMLPMKDGQLIAQGRLGEETMTLEHAREAAKQCVLNALSVIRAQIGTLTHIVRVVKVTGYVNATPDFSEHPAVLNGASDFLVETFGEPGRHVRAAVGVASLPLNAAVELDMMVEVKSP